MSDNLPVSKKKTRIKKSSTSHHDHSDHEEAEQHISFMDKVCSCFKSSGPSQKYAKSSDSANMPQLTKSQKRARARDNWGKLRSHVRNMRFKINFLAFSNDEAEMIKKIKGYDAD